MHINQLKPADTSLNSEQHGQNSAPSMSSAALQQAHWSQLNNNEESAELAAAWQLATQKLRLSLGETAWRRWLEPVNAGSFVNGVATLLLPSKFMRDWVESHYGEPIRNSLVREWPLVQQVRFALTADAAAPVTVAAPVSLSAGAVTRTPYQPHSSGQSSGQSSVQSSGAQVSGVHNLRVVQGDNAGFAGSLDEKLDALSSLDTRLTFENFVVGKPNELAYAAARRVAETATVTLNPLFLYGGVGLGKTHLMHAIAWHIRKTQPQRKVIYLSAEKFMYQFIRALRYKDTMAFKEQFRNVDVLMIDDVQFLCGDKESTQEEFFHTFNALVDKNRQVVISADKSPHDLTGMEERLRSRLGWGLCADIHPTTYELRLGILHAKAEQMKVQLPEKVFQFLAHKICSNVRELEGALNRIVAHSELVGREVTLEGAQELLVDVLRAHDRRVTIDEIQKRVAEHYNIKLADMHSAKRARPLARPRQVAMYLAKNLTPRSLPEIGRKFGGRDHTTVLHAVRKVEELMGEDSGFSDDVQLLKRLLAS